MPPRPASRGRRPSKASLTARPSVGNASELMPPPPIPASSPAKSTVSGTTPAATSSQSLDPMMSKILGPEVRALKECLIGSGVALAQIVNHYSDVKKLGAQRHAPYPPRNLITSWSRNIERYNDILDSMEVQVRRAVALLDAQIQAEQEKERRKQESSDIFEHVEEIHDPQLTTGKMEVDSGDTGEGVVIKTEPQDPTRLLGDLPLAEEPADSVKGIFPLGIVPSGAAVPAGPRRTGSISLASLNRPNRPSVGLKLDLSAASLRPLPSLDGTGIADGGKGDPIAQPIDNLVASPVTLAPKSAHPRAGDELFDMTDLDLIAAVQAQAEQDQMAINEINELAAAAEMAVIVGDGTAENPLEIDLDLFGEAADLGITTNANAGNTDEAQALPSGVDSLFSAGPDMADSLFSPSGGISGSAVATETDIKGIKSEVPADTTSASDLLASLGIPSAPVEDDVQPKDEPVNASAVQEEEKTMESLLPTSTNEPEKSLEFDALSSLTAPPIAQQTVPAANDLASNIPSAGTTPTADQLKQMQLLATQRHQFLARAFSAARLGGNPPQAFNLGMNANAVRPQLQVGGGLGTFPGMANTGMAGTGGPVDRLRLLRMAQLRKEQMELALKARQQITAQQHPVLPGGMLGAIGTAPHMSRTGGLSASSNNDMNFGAGGIGGFGMNFGMSGAASAAASNPSAVGASTLGEQLGGTMDLGALENLFGTGSGGTGFGNQFGQQNQR